MPLFLVKDIWEDFEILDYVCITTNSYINSDGNLCMGAGIALQAKKHNPDLPKVWGKIIRDKKLRSKEYNLLSHDKYIAFQTKFNYKDPSPVDLIERSTNKLMRLALKYPDKTFGLAYPGINNGQLTKDIVAPLLEQLPLNVTVYSRV